MRITKFSFLDKIIPCPIIMKIIKKFLFENCNSISIKKYINAYYNSINIGTINKILKWLRTAFAHYIKDIYRQNKLGKAQGGSNISIDESMFTHSNGNKIWVVGAINNKTRNIRCYIFYTRNNVNTKLFINNQIKKKIILLLMASQFIIFR